LKRTTAKGPQKLTRITAWSDMTNEARWALHDFYHFDQPLFMLLQQLEHLGYTIDPDLAHRICKEQFIEILKLDEIEEETSELLTKPIEQQVAQKLLKKLMMAVKCIAPDKVSGVKKLTDCAVSLSRIVTALASSERVEMDRLRLQRRQREILQKVLAQFENEMKQRLGENPVLLQELMGVATDAVERLDSLYSEEEKELEGAGENIQ